MSVDDSDNLIASAVAYAEPHDFRRMAMKQAALLKIGILRDDRESVRPSMLPNFLIGPPKQAALPDMGTAGKQRRQELREFG